LQSLELYNQFAEFLCYGSENEELVTYEEALMCAFIK